MRKKGEERERVGRRKGGEVKKSRRAKWTLDASLNAYTSSSSFSSLEREAAVVRVCLSAFECKPSSFCRAVGL